MTKKTYIINGVMCALCALCTALNLGVILRAWIDTQADVYDANEYTQELAICTAIVTAAVALLVVLMWIITRETEKYGI